MLSRSRMGTPQVGHAERGDDDGLASRHPVDHHVEERSDRETEEGTQPDQQSKHAGAILRAPRTDHGARTLLGLGAASGIREEPRFATLRLR